MAENKNDPSNLYDEEFMRKREEMFGAASAADEISSGREDEDDSFDEKDEDAFKEGGLFSKFKRSSKNKKKNKHHQEPEHEEKEGYDIFDLEIEPREKAAEKKEKTEAKKEKSSKTEISLEEMAARVLEEAFDSGEDDFDLENENKEVLLFFGDEAEKEEKAEKESFEAPEFFDEIEEASADISEEEKAEEKEAAEVQKDGEEAFEVTEADTAEEEKAEEAEEELSEAVESENSAEVNFSKEETAEEESEMFYIGEDLDDINALLESVGIMPLGSNDSKEKKEEGKKEASSASDEDDSDMKIAQPKKSGGVAAKADEKTRHFGSLKTKSASSAQGEKTEQLILEGYVDEEPFENTSEEEVEANLKSTRKRLIDNFRVLSKSTEDRTILEREGEGKADSSITENVEVAEGEGIFEAIDKAGKKVGAFLKKGERVVKSAQQKAKKEKKKEQIISVQALGKKAKDQSQKKVKQLIALVVLTALMILLGLLSKAYNPGGALDFLFGFGARTYSAINLVLMALCVVFSLDGFKKTVEAFKERYLDEGAGVFFITVCAAIQTLVALIGGLNEEKGFTLYTAFAGFSMICYQYGELSGLSLLQKNLKMIMRAGSLSGIQSVSNKADSAALGQGMDKKGEPNILYATDMNVPKNALSLSQSKVSDEKFYTFSSVAIILAGFVFSLVFSIVKKEASSFATVFAGFVCLCMPIARKVVITKLQEDVNFSLASHGGVVMGFDACDNVGKASAIALDCSDVFEAGVSKFRVVPGSKMAQSDAVVFAAATLKGTRCLLSGCFDDFIRESGIRLPEAEDVQYEERLGYSAWVAARKVLVGNREMLKAHSIECPSEEDEKRYSKGRPVLYVVVEGKIAATFIVNYAATAETRKSVQTFSKTGLVLMLNSAEPSLDEAFAAKKLGADITTVKIISSKGGEILTGYKNNPLIREDNGLLCSKKQKSLVQLANAAHNLCLAEKLALVLEIVGIILGVATLVFCAAMNVSAAFAVLTIIIMQSIWAVANYYVSKTRLK
ncbi:MAG: hypothetical protein IJ262_01600 [Clostridia bacterium]|nr:hypothetical protein [Clostridia bacterium]